MYEIESADLQQLIGQELASVIFVRDYVCLTFDPDQFNITAVSVPLVKLSDKTLGWNQVGYRDALCGLINQIVRETDIVPNDSVRIVFSSGVTILIPINPQDFGADEAMIFMGPTGWWTISGKPNPLRGPPETIPPKFKSSGRSIWSTD
jgi:hypothetical protein